MSFRTVIATLLAMTSAAAAEGELTLTPSCAEIDASRDTLPAAEREAARKQLDRILQGLDLLVVETGCVDHYVLSHEREGNDAIVRITGPAGTRRGRNPKTRAEAYEKLVIALLDAQEAAIEKAKEDAEAAEEAAKAALDAQAGAAQPAEETVAATEADTNADTTAIDPTYHSDNFDAVAAEEPSRVRTDWLLYGQLMAGSAGTGIGLGVRIPITTGLGLDFSMKHAEGDQTMWSSYGVKLVTYRSPDADSSSYFGGGIAAGVQNVRMYEGAYGSYEDEVAGLEFTGVAGYMFNRTGGTRLFVQADLSVPTFSGAHMATMASAGLGF